MQLNFTFPTEQKNKFSREDFLVLQENLNCVTYLKEIFAQEKYSESRLKSLIVKGEEASGKTHMLHAFMPKDRAEFILEEQLINLNLINFLQENHFYFLENVENFQNEELLFNLINAANENGAFLILTMSQQPNFKLKDLVSRFRNITTAEITQPSIESIQQLLINQLARKQIKLSRGELNSICINIERSYKAVVDKVREVTY